ncbi:MAG: hypothetical protein GTN93_07325, partial [Anaerolineae bacterium]|nr:hypothetical protein [Anaerolineae bacterium]
MTPKERVLQAQQRATIYYPSFGALLAYIRFIETNGVGTFKAHPTGVLEYDPTCVDVT